jgi:ABC-type multidrug transport system fused ATPase/permease subunit
VKEMTYVLEVNNLEFGYMENKKVLNNVSFNIEKGKL